MAAQKKGRFYVVATPIGNLGDMTGRAVEVLSNVDRILCEDTRHSSALLKHFSIKKPTLSLHQFNEKSRLTMIFEYIQQGEDIALVSDAGTPLISDPGYEVVRFLKSQEVEVVPIPGACAFIAALSASGMSSHHFIFEGFLPAKTLARQERLQSFAAEKRTLIFYEAPHRLKATLEDMQNIFGKNRLGSVAKELTKLHESIFTAPLSELYDYFLSHPQKIKGEFVIIVSGNPSEVNALPNEEAKILQLLLKELPLKKAVQIAAQMTGSKKNHLYDLALQFKNANSD